jgi:hypothetical protein
MTRTGFGIVGRGTFKVRAGVSTTISVPLTAAGKALLESSGGRLRVDFRLTFAVPGASRFVVRARTTLG